MAANEGFDVTVDGVARTFRDWQETTSEATRYLKTRHPKDFVELVDGATDAKLIVFEDGRVNRCGRSRAQA